MTSWSFTTTPSSVSCPLSAGTTRPRAERNTSPSDGPPQAMTDAARTSRIPAVTNAHSRRESVLQPPPQWAKCRRQRPPDAGFERRIVICNQVQFKWFHGPDTGRFTPPDCLADRRDPLRIKRPMIRHGREKPTAQQSCGRVAPACSRTGETAAALN